MDANDIDEGWLLLDIGRRYFSVLYMKRMQFMEFPPLSYE